MITFKTFLENTDASLIRQSQREGAKAEAERRQKEAEEFTKRSKEKAHIKRQKSQELSSHQKERTKLYLSNKREHEHQSRERIRRTSQQATSAAKGVVKGSKAVVGYVKHKLSNR